MRKNRRAGSGIRARGTQAGATTAELALVLPVVLTIVFSAIEFSRLNMLIHLAQVSAYEGARHGLVEGATVEEVETRVNAIVSHCVRAPATVTVTPSELTATTTDITVQVSIPISGNFWIMPTFVTAPVSGQCSLRTDRILNSG